MKCKIYLERGDLNDATSYYCEIIEEAMTNKGYAVTRVDNIKAINPADVVVVIQAKAFFKVWFGHKKQRIYIWFQGIVPEEAMMMFSDSWSRHLRFRLWRLLELIALKNCRFALFVSDAMEAHYKDVYGITPASSYVMPCFNLPLDNTSFDTAGKYTHPTFVYAGSLSTWQCIDQTLAAFKIIETKLPNAKLTLLTSQIDKGKEMAIKHGIINFEIKYVDADKLNAELRHYKYGFLLRHNNVVNHVATPTKMNSYLAAGIIPIYSNVIEAFKSEFATLNNIIEVQNVDQPEVIANKILEMESKVISIKDIRSEFGNLFDKYYNRTRYVAEIMELV